MKFQELVADVRTLASKIDASNRGFLAVQVNITGDDGGTFYVEVKDGKIHVEPYEYNDRNCAVTINMENFLDLISGKLDPVKAFTFRKLKVDGDLGKALEFANLLK
ncbi:MAG: SCP2 sterol-binding domain-containing protein [Blautia sp.]|nr:SCP2 sterol-binding domain-containing protein [Blautia sp.]